jgi:hypothetical protein
MLVVMELDKSLRADKREWLAARHEVAQGVQIDLVRPAWGRESSR